MVETKEQQNRCELHLCLGRLELEKIIVFWKCDRVFPLWHPFSTNCNQ
jgi:hypothetical protein